MPESSASEVKMAVEKPKRHKTPGNDQISEELIKAGGRTTPSEIHKLVQSIWNEEDLVRSGRSRSLHLFKRAIKQTIEIIETYHFCQVCTNFYPTSCCQG